MPKNRGKKAVDFYFQGEPAAKVLHDLEARLEQNRISKAEAALRAIWVLETIARFNDLQFDGKPVHVDWVYALVSDLLSSKIDTLDEAIHIGWLVHGLVVFGSSKIQAFRAIAQWLLISETKVRNAYHRLLKHGRVEGVDSPSTLLAFQKINDVPLMWIIDKNPKPFPKDFPKATLAFEKLKLAFSNGYRQNTFA